MPVAAEMAGRLAVDFRRAADPTNAAVFPPERVALQARRQGDHSTPEEHATVCTGECWGRPQPAIRGAFHMWISHEREYLDGMS
jgi:hypothetical protein